MEVRQLQIFQTLAEELNFTRTAERVHTVQSNVTAQIKALEEELGVPLFDRLGRRVVLTDAGHRFLPFAGQALSAMEQGQHAVQVGTEPSGPLRIAAPESVLTYRMPRVLRAFRKRFPDVQLTFRPYDNATLLAEIDSGKFDMAIRMADDKTDAPVESIRLRTERVFLLCRPEHPLGRKRTVKPADLTGQSFLLTECSCGYRSKLDRVFAMQNVRPGHVTEFSSVEAIKLCVAAGMGLALLPAIATARELREHQFKALDWAGPSLDVTTYLLWHRDKWVSPAMAAFRDLLLEMNANEDGEGSLLNEAMSA